MKPTVTVLSLLAVLLTGATACGSQSGSSNPDRQSDQVPVPFSTPSP